jgi:hypothetical protein
MPTLSVLGLSGSLERRNRALRERRQRHSALTESDLAIYTLNKHVIKHTSVPNMFVRPLVSVSTVPGLPRLQSLCAVWRVAWNFQLSWVHPPTGVACETRRGDS